MWAPEQIEETLTEREKKALNVWRLDPQEKPLALDLATRMQVLFLNGYDCETIATEFRGIKLGASVQARITFQWDLSRKEYNDRIRESLIERHVRAGLETAQTVLDILYCANDEIGKKAKDYMAGKTNELPVKVETVAQYKSLVELALRTLEGRSPNTEVKSNTIVVEENDKPILEQPQALTIPGQLSQLVKHRRSINA